MASKEQYAQWLVDNPDKKGTPEFETVAAAYKAADAPSAAGLPKGSALEAAIAGDPTRRMSGLQKFGAGAGKAVSDTGLALGQLAGIVSPDQVDATRKRDAPLMRTGAGMAGNIAGNIGVMAPAMMVPGAGTYAGAAALGAGSGFLSPTGEDDSRLKNTALGGAFGAAGKGAFDAVGFAGGKLLRAGESYIPSRVPSLAGRALNEAGGDRSAAFVQALKTNPTKMGTPNMSVGQAGASAQSPELSALMKMGARKNPALQTTMTQGENQEIRDVMRGITGKAGALESKEAVRQANATKAYGDAYAAPLKRTSGFNKVLKDPFVKQAINDAADIAESQGVKKGTTEYFHLVKKALDDIRDTAKANGLGKNKRIAIGDARDVFIKELGKSNPVYDKARLAFQAESPPINKMQVGKVLEEKIFSAIDDAPLSRRLNPKSPLRSTDPPAPITEINPKPFMDALRKGDKLAQKAVNYKGATLKSALGTDLGKIEGIRQRLANTKDFNKLAAKGGYAADDALASSRPEQLPGLLERDIVIANALLGRAGKHETKVIVDYLSKNIDKPQEIARVMENASPEQNKAVRAIIQVLRRSAPVITAQGVQ